MTRNSWFFFFLLAVSVLVGQNGKGKSFPDIEAATFEGKKVALPGVCYGKMSLIGICFSRDAESALRTWLTPAYEEFIQKKDTVNGLGAVVNRDVNLYFFPMMSMLNQILEKQSREKIRKETDPELWPHLIFYFGGIKEYKKSFAPVESGTPYFFVIDKKGIIVHVEKGAYTSKKMDAMLEFLDED